MAKAISKKKKEKKNAEGKYVDGFVIAIPKKNLAAYKKMAKMGEELWMKHGALDYKECVGDDLNLDMGGMKGLAFPELINRKKNEVVVFSYITFKSRAHRDKVNKKVMEDPMMDDAKYKDKPMPFEMNRMAYGGFKVFVG